MTAQKNPEVDLKLHYQKNLELGFVLALIIVLGTFQSLRKVTLGKHEFVTPDIKIEVEEIPPSEQIKRPPMPARPTVPIPTEDEDVPEDETIETTEIDFDNIPDPPPEPVEDDPGSYTFIPYDEPPEMIGGMAALKKHLVYPEIARKAGVEGVVHIGVLVDAQGNVAKLQVLKSSVSNVGFEEAAMKALRQVKWKPAFQRDRPIKVWISIPVKFRLQDAPS